MTLDFLKMSSPTVSIPLEEGEEVKAYTLQEHADRLAKELERVKSIVDQVSVQEIGARIEEIKITLSMLNRLIEVLVLEHTKRMNVREIPFDKIEDVEEVKNEDVGTDTEECTSE